MFTRLFRRRPSTPAARVPDGARIYAIGDIHGRADLLARLLDIIRADLGDSGGGQLVFLGDYVDRGVASRDVIDLLLDGLPLGMAASFLKGNHEAAMLDFLADPGIGPDWVAFGGGATLLSYGVAPDVVQRGDFPAAREQLDRNLPDRHRAFLHALAPSVRIGDYLFAHAGVRPGVPLDRQSERDLCWIRDEFLRSSADFGAVVVHGHTVREEPEVKPNRIGIDTGAYATGRLTALVLEGTGRRFLQT